MSITTNFNTSTWVFISIDTFIFVLAIILGVIWSKNGLLIDKTWRQKSISSTPSTLSTIGVLGTFFGITVGLSGFDTNNLDLSIPELLEGMKTAFYTSLAGMSLSLLYHQLCLPYLNIQAEKRTDIDVAATVIVDAVEELRKSISTISNRRDDNQSAFYKIATQQIEQIGKDISDLLLAIKAETAETTRVKTQLEAFNADVNDSLSETQNILTIKFDEFSKLLSKSNTEALVDVMRNVTEQFQAQMNELISKLVQENFALLNESVRKLVSWQQENKEMVAALVRQYKEMTTEFETSSTILSSVSNNVKELTGNGSKLHQIVRALNEVMVEDERFRTITNNLLKSIDLWNNCSRELDNWIDKNLGLINSLNSLVVKLDEVSKLKEANGEFWTETRRGLNEGVGLIKQQNEEMSKLFKRKDQEFYNRLEATLSNLDRLIVSAFEYAEHHKND